MQPVIDVANHLGSGQWFQSRAHGDALSQLCHSWSRQPLFEFRLPGEHDLQQLSVRRLEIGEQANRFQYGIGEVLGLVNEQHNALPGFRFAKQEVIQVRVHAHDVPVLAVEAQVFHQIAQEFPGIALCLEQEGAVDVALPSLEQLEEQSGLSHPGLSYKREKSTAGLNSVEQRRQRLSVGRAEIQEPRIRSYTEGLFAQSVKIKKHRLVAILGDCCNHWTSQKTFYFFWCTE